MVLFRWKPSQEMANLDRQMDQIFDELMQARQNSSLNLSNFRGWGPAIEVKETDIEIVLHAEVPGVEAEDLNVQVTGKAVSITGEHRYEQRNKEKTAFALNSATADFSELFLYLSKSNPIRSRRN